METATGKTPENGPVVAPGANTGDARAHQVLALSAQGQTPKKIANVTGQALGRVESIITVDSRHREREQQQVWA